MNLSLRHFRNDVMQLSYRRACALVTAILLLQFMPLSLLLRLCMIFNIMGLCPSYTLLFFQPCGKQTSVLITHLNCVLFVTYKLLTNVKLTVWTDQKGGHTESHPPSMNQTAVVKSEAGCWQRNESEREHMLVDCHSWLLETAEKRPAAATVPVAAPSGWCSVVLLV